MREAFSTTLLERLSALLKSERFSSPWLQEALARLSAFAKAKRLSPLMLTALSLLCVTTTLSALFFLRALIGWNEAAPAAAADWRPPSASFLNPSPSQPPPADVHTLTRPTFVKSRRPAPKVAGTAAPQHQAGPPPAVTVRAIVLWKGAWRAYLVGQGGAEGDWRLAGEIVEGWTIAEIRATELTLKNGERTAVLSLYPEPPAAGEAEASPPPPIPPFIPPGSPPGGPPPGPSAEGPRPDRRGRR